MKRSEARLGTRKVVCLDIGSSALRGAQFSLRTAPVGGKSCRLERYASVPLPPGAVAGGVVADPAAVGKALRALWSSGRFSTKRVVFGMANDRILVRQLDLDWMEPADFRKALAYTVADQIPMAVDEANLDYHVLEDIAPGPDGEGERTLRVLLVAAARDMVDTYLAALDEAHLLPLKADLSPFALIRAAAAGVGEAEGDLAEAIVDIGSDTLTVVVHTAGQPRFVRTVGQLGGRLITGELQQKFGWTYEEAEAAKTQYGLPRQRTGSDDLVGLEHPAQQAIEERVTAVVGEVRTTLNFFLSAGTGVQGFSRVVITGGGSRLTGLQDRIAAAMNAEVVVLSRPDGIKTKGAGPAPDEDDFGAVALLSGLAMGVK